VFPALLSAILFSISGVCGHRAAKSIGGTEANFWRLTFSAVFLTFFAYIWGVGMSSPSFPLFFLSGVIGIGIGDVAYFQALPKLGSRLSLLLIECLSAPVAAAIEWAWLGTTLTSTQMIFGIVVLLGVAVALVPSERGLSSRNELFFGSALCALSALSGGYGVVLSRKAFAVDAAAGFSLSAGNASFQRVLGGLLVGGICLLFVKRREFRVQARAPRHLVTEVAKRKWQAVCYWVLLNSLAGQTLGVSSMQWALKTTPGGIVLAIIALTPILIIPLAVWIEGERPSRISLVGSLIAVGGVIGLALVK
jgi:drug/metabolite transporter (DMT)-like permease